MGTGGDCAAIRLMEKIPHAQPISRSKIGAAIRGSRVKIVSGVAGMLEVIRSPSENGPFVVISQSGD